MKDHSGVKLGKVGFFVTNKSAYKSFLNNHPEFKSESASVFTEWNIIKEAQQLNKPDMELLNYWENEIGDPTLWNAVISDRRLDYPISAQFIQNYRPAYNHEFILKLVQVALLRIDEHFDAVAPDAILGLNAVTLYDYIYYLIAKSRGIPYLQLKLTRVSNYVSFFSNPLGISPHIEDRYSAYMKNPEDLKENHTLFQKSLDFINGTRSGSLSYEGAISKKKQNIGERKRSNIGAMSIVKKNIAERLSQLIFPQDRDPHYPTPLQSFWYSRGVKPFRRVVINKIYKNVFANDWRELSIKYSYALYPLNTEPEVALLVYGRTYRNQIETVRNVASSLPLGWKLFVKEHPNAKGYRSKGFYEKLNAIPNVVLIGSEVSTEVLIRNAELVFVVFGTIGLEAILKKKPVISLSQTPYGTFPPNMVRCVESLPGLAAEIRDLLEKYNYDEWALISYIAAYIEGSIPLNLFTGLLGKRGRESIHMEQTLEEQYQQLAKYTINRIYEERRIVDSVLERSV